MFGQFLLFAEIFLRQVNQENSGTNYSIMKVAGSALIINNTHFMSFSGKNMKHKKAWAALSQFNTL